jgi:hypothetical protein
VQQWKRRKRGGGAGCVLCITLVLGGWAGGGMEMAFWTAAGEFVRRQRVAVGEYSG